MSPMMPPLPPNVAAQQAPPSELAYMRMAGAAEQGAQPAGDAGWESLVSQRLTQVTVLLKDVADVLAVRQPALLEPLKIMVQAGSKLMSEVQPGADQPSPEGSQVQAQNPTPGDAAGMVSMG